MGLKRLARDESAQGLIEFAILATVAILIFFGTVDFSRFLYYDNAIRNAARVGAEVASQHCPYAAGTCAISGAATSDPYIIWSTSCESSGTVKLTPSFADCTPSSASNWSPCVAPCGNCMNDICVSSPDSPRVTHSDVTVDVGYDFKPLSPVMAPFFQERSCFLGDAIGTAHHTLCAEAIGRVF
jgi:Flp pilus assembly protein TadG